LGISEGENDMNYPEDLLIILRLIILSLGILIAYNSYNLSKINVKARGSYLLLSLAFLIFSIGAVIEGVLYEFTSLSIIGIHMVEGVLSIISFSLVIESIRGNNGGRNENPKFNTSEIAQFE